MGRQLKSDAKPEKTTNLAWNIKDAMVEEFYAVLKRKRLPLYIVLETFMQQFCDGGFKLEEAEITKFDRNRENTRTIHTMANKKIYFRFKSVCEEKGYVIGSVMSAFVEKFLKEEYVLELRSTADIEKEAEMCNCMNALMRFYELMKEEEQKTRIE